MVTYLNLVELVSGGTGAAIGALCGYPLDTVKIRLQTQDPKRPTYRGAIDCFRQIVAKEAVSGLFKGWRSPVYGQFLFNAIVFSVEGQANRELARVSPFFAEAELARSATSGMVAGGIQAFVCGPIELIKTRQQVSGIGAMTKRKKEWQVARDIVRTEGVRGLTRGLGLTIVREVPAFGSYFFAYETFYKYGNQHCPAYPTAVTMFAGGMAGVACWVFSYPSDVIKTRMQADGLNGVKQYRNTWHCYQMAKLEGGSMFNPRSAFWVGFCPTALRAFPVNAITFTVVDWMANTLIALNPNP